MKPLTIEEHGSKRCLFDYIYNDLGYTGLQLCYSYKGEDGQPRFSPWVRYSVLLYLEDNQYIPNINFRISKKKFLERVSHRSVVDIELMLDVDDDMLFYDLVNHKKDAYHFASIREKAKWIVDTLKCLGASSVTHSTGSKGYHISLLHPRLRDMSIEQRRSFKRKICLVYGCDIMKAGPKVMISCEGAEHWKSGKMKEQVEL